MNYNITKTLKKRQWQTVISLIKDAIRETNSILAEHEQFYKPCDILRKDMEEQKAEFEEILVELQ